MEVEAGCILQVAQEAAAEKGLLLPVSLKWQNGSARSRLLLVVPHWQERLKVMRTVIHIDGGAWRG